MKEILDVADSNSLVLIDEICSGTDPREGGALAAGILDTFIDLNLFFVVTTHQSSLKTYALNSKSQYSNNKQSKNQHSKEFEHNNFENKNLENKNKLENNNELENKNEINKNRGVIENCSFEFDETALKPTYNFLSGIPGNSYAFFLAKNVGLSNRVINRSKKYLGNRQKQLERSISVLQKFKKETEDIIKESRAEKLKYEGMRKDYENRKKEFVEKKKSLLDEAKLEANEILQKANALVENTIRDLREEKKSITEAKTEFVKQQKEIEAEAKMIKTQKQQLNLNIEIAENLKPDDTVGMLDSPEIGIVLDADNDNKTALVEFNGMKFRLPFSQLYLKEKPTVRKSSTVELKLDVKIKLDLRGFRADEALNETTNFISQAIMGNADYITIIHGKGTGALRLAIHELLKQTNGVKSFRLGEIFEGGSGVTVAYLK
jgi:DNA mismatch repair protein MutS2